MGSGRTAVQRPEGQRTDVQRTAGQRALGPIPKCVIDRSRPCTSCVADGPATCPYPYLLAEGDAA